MEELPIVLEMNVHCRECSQNIRRSLRRMFGADSVSTSVQTGMVVVRGGAHLDPWTLKCFLQRLWEARPRSHGGSAYAGRRRVTIVNDGGRPQTSHFEGVTHLAPPMQQYAPSPPLYYQYGGRPRWYDDPNPGGGCIIL